MPIHPDQPAQTDPGIDELAAQIKDLMSSRQLVAIPTMPLRTSEVGFVAFLSQDDMSASDFCDIAVAAGVKVFYVQADAFDAETDLRMDRRRVMDWQNGESEDPRLLSLRGEASAFNGRIGEIELGFALSGILNCWIATAPWFDHFIERLGNLEPSIDPRFERMPEAEEQAMVDRLAQALIQMPEFRSAPSAAQQRRLAHAQPEIAALEADTRPGYSHVAYRAVREAQERIAAEADSKYREMEARLVEVAAECEATPAFRSAGSARARKEHARDFLMEKAGGYPPPTRLLELFLDTPPLQKGRAGRH